MPRVANGVARTAAAKDAPAKDAPAAPRRRGRPPKVQPAPPVVEESASTSDSSEDSDEDGSSEDVETNLFQAPVESSDGAAMEVDAPDSPDPSSIQLQAEAAESIRSEAKSRASRQIASAAVSGMATPAAGPSRKSTATNSQEVPETVAVPIQDHTQFRALMMQSVIAIQRLIVNQRAELLELEGVVSRLVTAFDQHFQTGAGDASLALGVGLSATGALGSVDPNGISSSAADIVAAALAAAKQRAANLSHPISLLSSSLPQLQQLQPSKRGPKPKGRAGDVAAQLGLEEAPISDSDTPKKRGRKVDPSSARSKRRARDPNMPIRPGTSYLLFCQAIRPQVREDVAKRLAERAATEGSASAEGVSDVATVALEIQNELAKRWAELPEQSKLEWRERYQALFADYTARMKAYKEQNGIVDTPVAGHGSPVESPATPAPAHPATVARAQMVGSSQATPNVPTPIGSVFVAANYPAVPAPELVDAKPPPAKRGRKPKAASSASGSAVHVPLAPAPAPSTPGSVTTSIAPTIAPSTVASVMSRPGTLATMSPVHMAVVPPTAIAHMAPAVSAGSSQTSQSTVGRKRKAKEAAELDPDASFVSAVDETELELAGDSNAATPGDAETTAASEADSHRRKKSRKDKGTEEERRKRKEERREERRRRKSAVA